jgi:hypothetical protein
MISVYLRANLSAFPKESHNTLQTEHPTRLAQKMPKSSLEQKKETVAPKSFHSPALSLATEQDARHGSERGVVD